ncbi:MAG: outer membrane protein assembly factor BamA [Nitrospiraceae bacterium]|nr:outer membrane protein assembly factor BamA [Nitrospiraceae bacterium]
MALDGKAAVTTVTGGWFIRALSLLLALLITTPGVVQAQDGEQKVKSIQIRGAKRIEETAVRGRLTLKVGDQYTGEAVRTQIRLIYEMGFYEDVRIETEPVPGGVAIVFVVREKPFITDIVFDGNDSLSDDKLKEKITIRNNSFLDQQQAKESAERVRQAYQEDGYYNVQVVPIIQSVEEDRKRLTLFVKEGDRAKIKAVNFEGMSVFKKKEMLKNLATREWIPLYGIITQLSLPSTFSDSGLLKRDEMANDAERIRGNYYNKGHLNVQVSAPVVELTEDKKWFTVTFTIVEGDAFTVGEIGYRGNTLFEEEELRAGSKLVSGEIVQVSKVFDENKRIKDLYGTKGYSFADSDYGMAKDEQAKTAALVFNIKEGELIRVRKINISGNDKTRDNVIRREVRINEQEVIDTVSMQRSFQRLNNLQFFETVEILPQQVSPDKVDLNVKVKEKNTGQFSIGGGYSTLDQLTSVIDITEGNLQGRGHMLKIRGQLGQRRNLGLITFREPYFRDSQMSMQLDVFNTVTNYQTYIENKSGVTLSFGRWFSEFASGAFSPIAENLTIKDVQQDAPQFAKAQLGKQSTSGFRSVLSRDTRDNYMDPRNGTRSAINLDYGSKYLGGSNNFYKFQIDAVKYTPLFWDTRHAIRARFGVTEGLDGAPIPLTELFYVGGINTMRGFVFGRAGPVTPSGTLIGANRQVIINNDFIFPISAEAKLNGVIFFDYGKGFLEGEEFTMKFRQSAGVEARWLSPFGPLRLAYGFNLDPNPQERKQVFEFSIGSLF